MTKDSCQMMFKSIVSPFRSTALVDSGFFFLTVIDPYIICPGVNGTVRLDGHDQEGCFLPAPTAGCMLMLALPYVIRALT